MVDVAPGLYQVDVDLSALASSVNVSQVEDGLYDDDMLRLFNSGIDGEDDDCGFLSSLTTPPPPSPPVYHLYVVTPRDKAVEYVMRLPYFLSDLCFVSLEDCMFPSTPTWYTFSNHQSVLYITFTTSSPPLLVANGLRDFASWVDMCTSWCLSYSHLFAPTFHPNIASMVCTTLPVLSIDHDQEGPLWSPLGGEAVPVFEHTLQVTPPPPLAAPPDWVRHMSTHLDVYAMHARFTRVERYHVEPRRSTPPPQSPAGLPSPSPSSTLQTLQTLQPGDWVVYLTPAADSFECAQVVNVSPTVTLDTEACPSHIAKLDAQQHCLLSDLLPFDAFLTLA